MVVLSGEVLSFFGGDAGTVCVVSSHILFLFALVDDVLTASSLADKLGESSCTSRTLAEESIVALGGTRTLACSSLHPAALALISMTTSPIIFDVGDAKTVVMLFC
jgi:hypothetical protein